MQEYVVIYERGQEGEENWGAYVPDLPGCATTGDTLEEAREAIRDAIAGHIEALKATGQPVPPPTTQTERVAVAA